VSVLPAATCGAGERPNFSAVDLRRRIATRISARTHRILYISEGLRRDEAQAELQTLRRLTEALKKRGVKESVLKEALAESRGRSAE
jgi:hypothetical protein